MEDLEKYIFDPKNPKGCKVYNLLLKIVKERNYAVFLSPYFFLHIFENEIFDLETVKSLWDKPDNFSLLPTLDKVRIYNENFSTNEFILLLRNKYNKDTFNSKISKILFPEYLVPRVSSQGKFSHFESSNKFILSQLEELYLNKGLLSELKPVHQQSLNKNIVFFLDKDTYNFINGFAINFSSVVITTLDDYSNKSITNKFIKPLILKDIGDILTLLDVLYRDLVQERAKAQHKFERINYLKNINLKNFFAIDQLKLQDLGEIKEIYFVGENGDGKTVLLQAITLALKGNQQEGIIIDFIKQNNKQDLTLKATDSGNQQYSFTTSENNNSHRNLFAYGAHRYRNDSDKAEDTGYLTLFNDEQYLNNPVKWLQHLDYKQAKGEETSISLETAKQLLKAILNDNVEIEVSPDEVAFIERGTKLKFEQLSEGYKSVIVWVSDLIKRFSDNQPYASSTADFKGIVLIDEIELHLHPKWKYRIVKDLRTWFPGIQFIFTTHSPTIILGASADAVFYKVYKEEGVTKVSSPIQDISHLTANSLLTSPLFELESMTSRSSSLLEQKNISSDDYIYQKIHTAVAEKINNNPNLIDADVMKMVEEELRKLESENDKSS